MSDRTLYKTAATPVMSSISDGSIVTGYDLACAALVAIKQENVIDLVYDDRVIAALSNLPRAVTELVIRVHLENALGRPSEESIDQALLIIEQTSMVGWVGGLS